MCIRDRVKEESRRRLRNLVEARPLFVRETEGEERFVYALPLRRTNPTAPDGFEVAGSIEVARSLSQLSAAWRDDLLRTLPLFAGILVVVIVAVMLFARTLVTRPIEKLLH